MSEKPTRRRLFYRPATTTFARILLTLGSGESPWLILAFVLGVAALGIFSNLMFAAAYDASSLTPDRLLRVGAVVALCVVLAYLIYRFDLWQAWRLSRLQVPLREEQKTQPHAGLIWLLSIGKGEVAKDAIDYHLKGEGGEPLQHCWLLISPAARATYERLALRLEELAYPVKLHPLYLDAATITASYQATLRVYAEEAQRAELRPDQIIADITGGSKTMTAGMVMACLPYGRPVEYIESEYGPDGKLIEGTQYVMGVSLH